MRKDILLIILTLIIVVLIGVSLNLYKENVDGKHQLLKKELLIFQNHITATVRAVEAENRALLKDTSLRVKTFETFHSIEQNSNAQLTVSAYEQGIKYLLDTDTSKYREIMSDLRDIFKAVTSQRNNKLDQEQFNKIINETLPLVEQFRDNAKQLKGK